LPATAPVGRRRCDQGLLRKRQECPNVRRHVLRQLTTFVRIAEMGSISRAARALRISVPVASRHVKWLEDDLRAPLLRRTTRRLELTEAGIELLTRARLILASVDEARQSVRSDGSVVGQVVVAAQPAFGLTHVAPRIASLLDAHPSLRIDLRFLERPVDLIADGVDVAIRGGPLPPPDSTSVIARRVARYTLMFCASPAYLARHGKPGSLADLARMPCVILEAVPKVWTVTTSRGTESVIPAGRVRANDLFAVRQLVLDGAGLAWMPSWFVEDDLRRRRLARVLPDVQLPTIDVFAYYLHQSRSASALRVVVAALEHDLAPEKG
jgi:DNA-binding transcriptional LysR family regulator